MTELKNLFRSSLLIAVLFCLAACVGDREDDTVIDPQGGENSDFVNLLTNQVEGVIIPTMVTYQSSITTVADAAQTFAFERTVDHLDDLITAYQNAYLDYQAAAVHNYFATANHALVMSSNLYPVDPILLEQFASNREYNFNTTAQQSANGFPALDYMFFGNENTLGYLVENDYRVEYMLALVNSMKEKADILVSQWTGDLKDNFINNGGTALGSSISVQLNDHMSYYEEHVRENKVGIPIGLLGPNDDSIAEDGTKIEAYYQSLRDGNDAFALQLLRAAVEEVEDIYLGSDVNGQGYDDLVLTYTSPSLDEDIKNQFSSIYTLIKNRVSIMGDDSLYQGIQDLVTLYKSDLFPLLNVQDADGANDGD